MTTPLRAVYDNLPDLVTLLEPFDLLRRRAHPEVSHQHRTVLALRSAATHPDVSQYQTLRLTLAFYHTDEQTAYETAVAAYDTLIARFGPPNACTNTWTLYSTDATPAALYDAFGITVDPPFPVGSVGPDTPVLYLVTLPLSLQLSASL